jgi:glucosamine 6-phosphate synthetase-like amidotransferase/phosphosugar isomerase protein
MHSAAKRGYRTLAISNTRGSRVVGAAERALVFETNQACGPCISVISTRVLLVTMLALELGRKAGRTLDPALGESLGRLGVIGRNFLRDQGPFIEALARQYKGAESFLLVGSGPNYFTVREGTLKIEEQAILVAKAYRTGDFHHDALSLLDPTRPVIAVQASGAANDRVVDALRASREAGAPRIAVTWDESPDAASLAAEADHHLSLGGSLPEIIAPIALTLVFQLLGYHLGVERGFNPDTLRTDHLPNARAWLTAFPMGTH